MTICDICGRHIEKIKKTQRIFVRKDPEGNSRVIEAGGYDLPFHCNYCGGTFCTDHRLPENHNCSYDFTAERTKQISSPITSYEAGSILREARNMDECLKDKIKKINKKVDGIHDHDGTKVIHDDDGQLWIHGRRHSRVEVIEEKEKRLTPRSVEEKLNYMDDFEYIGDNVEEDIGIEEGRDTRANTLSKINTRFVFILIVIGVVLVVFREQVSSLPMINVFMSLSLLYKLISIFIWLVVGYVCYLLFKVLKGENFGEIYQNEEEKIKNFVSNVVNLKNRSFRPSKKIIVLLIGGIVISSLYVLKPNSVSEISDIPNRIDIDFTKIINQVNIKFDETINRTRVGVESIIENLRETWLNEGTEDELTDIEKNDTTDNTGIFDTIEEKVEELMKPNEYKDYYFGLVKSPDGVISNSYGEFIVLINNKNATNPIYSQLCKFLKEDKTDEYPYQYIISVGGSYYGSAESNVDLDRVRKIVDGTEQINTPRICSDFAEMLHNNAELAGFRCGYISIELSGYPDPYNLGMSSDSGHALVVFNTTDRGLVYIDSTGGIGDGPSNRDSIVDVEINSHYIPKSLFPEKGWKTTGGDMGVVTDIYLTWDGDWDY